MERKAEEIKEFVRERYGGLAKQKSQSCCGPQTASTCCGQQQTRAKSLYAGEEIDRLPSDVADFSLGCGNPLAIAELSVGEVVLDLGSGGGLDCFLAGRKVGKEGRVIGLDMTAEMVQLARKNAEKVEATNVEFRLGEMERMPVTDNSIDVIISNCVINLSPDKDAVFREAYRVLKPGGRISISDMVLVGELPKEIKESVEQWAGCIAGALDEKDYLGKIKAAGFVKITADRTALPLYTEGELGEDKSYLDLVNKVASVRVKAYKPKRARKPRAAS